MLCCDASERLQPAAEIANHALGVLHVVERAGVDAVGSDLNGKCGEVWGNRREKARSGAQGQPNL